MVASERNSTMIAICLLSGSSITKKCGSVWLADLSCGRDLRGSWVYLSPLPHKLIQVMGAKDRAVSGQVVKVIHDDRHKQVQHLQQRVNHSNWMDLYILQNTCFKSSNEL